jgi:hypothetical protein
MKVRVVLRLEWDGECAVAWGALRRSTGVGAQPLQVPSSPARD